MKSQSQQSIGEELAAFLSARRESIIAEWVATVDRDPNIPSSAHLSLHQLRDHLPRLFDNLSRTLRDAFSKEIRAELACSAAKHGEHRWKEGYDLIELLREFAHLRSAFIFHLIAFEESHPDFGGAARVFALVTFHRFLDDAVRSSVEQFREEQNPEERK